MMPRPERLPRIGGLVLVLVSAGCATTYRPSEQARILDLPAIRQAPDHCGPAVLHAVYRHWGFGESEAAVARRVLHPDQGGTLPAMLVADARRRGFGAAVGPADASVWRQALSAGVPPICLQSGGSGHFVLLQGFDRDRFLVNDGSGRLRWARPVSGTILSVYIWPADYAFDPPPVPPHDGR